MHTYQFCFYHFDIKLFGAFRFVPRSLFLFLSLVALWHLNGNPLCPRTLFVLGHLHPLPLLILLHLTFDSMMIKPVRTFQRNFHDAAFIQNTKSFYQTFPILTFPLSSIVGVRSHYVTSWSLVPPWSYRSFTLICTDLILQYLSFLLTFKVCTLWSLWILYPRCSMSRG